MRGVSLLPMGRPRLMKLLRLIFGGLPRATGDASPLLATGALLRESGIYNEARRFGVMRIAPSEGDE